MESEQGYLKFQFYKFFEMRAPEGDLDKNMMIQIFLGKLTALFIYISPFNIAYILFTAVEFWDDAPFIPSTSFRSLYT